MNLSSMPFTASPALTFRYQFHGVIGAESQHEISQLVLAVGKHPVVLLDFSTVVRINSMGVALLLKALKELKQHGKQIQITGTNKMTQMLFRMMGISNWATIQG
jgi:anti-anti-sigma factor